MNETRPAPTEEEVLVFVMEIIEYRDECLDQEFYQLHAFQDFVADQLSARYGGGCILRADGTLACRGIEVNLPKLLGGAYSA